MKTPAMTARRDARKILNVRRSRRREVEERTLEIRSARVAKDGLLDMYRTDPEGAIARLKVLTLESRKVAEQDIPERGKSPTQVKRFTRARALRGAPRLWRSEGRARFESQMSRSANRVTEQIAMGQEAIAWLTSCIPTVADFTGIEGKIVVGKDEMETSSHGAIIRIIDTYDALVRDFNFFIDIWGDRIENYEEELDVYQEEPLSDIIAVVESLGLEQIWLDSDDGCLWFRMPGQDDPVYFLNIVARAYTVGGSCDIMDTARVASRRRGHSEWEDRWDLDLSVLAIDWVYNPMTAFADDCRKDPYRVYQRIRSWVIRSVDSGNVPPSFFPADLVE